ncbi:MAG: ribosome small subunit-dependent GTPase A [Bacteroidota bacterium]
MRGTVFKSTGSWYEVLGEDGQFYQCRVRGKFRLENKKVTNPIAVGDIVTFELESADEDTAVITSIESRENYIIRKSVKKSHHAHIIASNIDQALLLVTLSYPRTSVGFIDRFTVSAESFRIPTILVFNKMDMLTDEEWEELEDIVYTYESIGFKCITISALEQHGLDEVKEVLRNKTTLVSGHSGVGKSTMINALNPDIDQKIGEVSDFANKGIHTTTFAEMFEVDQDTYIIDTPGIKELGLFEIEGNELSDYFPEMRALIGQCKFHNCTHTNEPGCAIIRAVEEGEIAGSRYYSYLSMLEDEDNRR